MTKRIAILGAGVCGLATALKLLEIDPKADVTLYESEDRVGGLARSLTVGDQTADMGPHRIHTELPDVQEFLQEIAGDELERVERRSRMWIRDRWIEYPPQPIETLKVFGPLTLAKVLASFGENALGMGPKSTTDNYEAVMTKAFGKALYRLIALDYTRKVWKIDPKQIHGDIARVRVSAGGLDRLIKRVLVGEKEGQETALKKFYYLEGGVETLAKKMEQRILAAGGKIEVSRRVTDLRRDRDGWSIFFDGVPEATSADLVFSTVPITDLLELLLMQKENERVRKAREEMRFIANFLVCVVLKKPEATNCQWLYFPGRDTVFNRACEPKNFSSSMGDADSTMMVLEITCHHGDKVWNASDQSLIKKSIAGLIKTGLAKEEEIGEAIVHRIPYTYPLYDLEYRERLDHVWKYLSKFPGLISVGRQGLFLHNNMDHSIHMGFRAGEVALRENPEHPERKFYNEVRRFQQFRIVD